MIANVIAIVLTIALWPIIGPWALLCIVFYKLIAAAITVPIAAAAATIQVAREKIEETKKDRDAAGDSDSDPE